MPSLQYKISESILRYNFNRNRKKQANELRLGKAFEMPRPPDILKRGNRIEEYRLGRHNIYTCNPEILKSPKIILYLHGGAYYTRITLPHWLYIRKLSNHLGMKVIIPDYPTAPAYNYLQTNDFAIRVYKRLLQDHQPADIYFFGDSAGGGLCLTLSESINRQGLEQPRGLVLFSPWLDVSMTNPGIQEIEHYDYMLSADNLKIAGELYAEDADLKDPLISPLYGNLKKLPPSLLFIGTHDILLPDCRKFRDLSIRDGIKLDYMEYEGMLHCWMLFPVPEADEVLGVVQKKLAEM